MTKEWRVKNHDQQVVIEKRAQLRQAKLDDQTASSSQRDSASSRGAGEAVGSSAASEVGSARSSSVTSANVLPVVKLACFVAGRRNRKSKKISNEAVDVEAARMTRSRDLFLRRHRATLQKSTELELLASSQLNTLQDILTSEIARSLQDGLQI